MSNVRSVINNNIENNRQVMSNQDEVLLHKEDTNMKKKLLTLLLCCFTITSMLTGCGSKKEETSTNTSVKEEKTTEADTKWKDIYIKAINDNKISVSLLNDDDWALFELDDDNIPELLIMRDNSMSVYYILKNTVARLADGSIDKDTLFYYNDSNLVYYSPTPKYPYINYINIYKKDENSGSFRLRELIYKTFDGKSYGMQQAGKTITEEEFNSLNLFSPSSERKYTLQKGNIIEGIQNY